MTALYLEFAGETGTTSVDPITEEEGLLRGVGPRIAIAGGRQRESKISAWNINYKGTDRVGVFVYPASYQLTPERIISLNHHNVDGSPVIIRAREFKDRSFEELDNDFIREVGPASAINISLKDMSARTRIIGHVYSTQAENWIVSCIDHIR
jgi:hypothetical protein